MGGMRFATVVVCATVWMSTLSVAQGLREIAGPSELPSASYKSDQYVDSRGCVFIRAGYGGTVTWVPRVGNNRKPICGQRASLAVEAPVVAAAEPVVAAPAVKVAAAVPATPVLAAAARPVRQPVAVPQSQYVPARVVQVTPPPQQTGRVKVHLVTAVGDCPAAPTGARRGLSDGRLVQACGTAASGLPVYLVVGRKGQALPAPAPVVAAPVVVASVVAAAVVAAPATRVSQTPVATAAACGPLQKINPLFLADDGRLVVRCGTSGGKAVYLVVGHAGLDQVAQRGPASAVAANTEAQPIPRGYRLAWDDGRLSGTRGSRSAAGDAAMRLVWTDDVPRRLIDRATGKDVSLNYAALEFPFTTYAKQAAVPRVSAMNAPAAAFAGRYVQAGSYGLAKNAASAAVRLKAAGLPVRLASVTQGGRALQIVLAGPFGANQLAHGLAIVRQAGFADAFAMN